MSRRILLPCLSLAALAACAAAFAPSPLPAFDAVTIQRYVPRGRPRHQPRAEPEQLSIEGNTPEQMILYAYGIQNDQITGLPSWAQDMMYKFIGVTHAPATPTEMKLMLQRALADRFQFAFTTTDTPQPVDELEVAPGGAKFKPLPAGTSCAAYSAQVVATHQPPIWLVPVKSCTIAALVKLINFGRHSASQPPVVDKTGLSGQYGMLVWEPMKRCGILADNTVYCRQRVEPLENVVQSQLGLELVPATAPRRVLHVTRIARPSLGR